MRIRYHSAAGGMLNRIHGANVQSWGDTREMTITFNMMGDGGNNAQIGD